MKTMKLILILILLLAFAAYNGWTQRSGNDSATADLDSSIKGN